jgi:hypothetical protein
MVEPTFRMLEIASALGVLATGTRISYGGEENIPERGGAVIAITTPAMSTFCPPHWLCIVGAVGSDS